LGIESCFDAVVFSDEFGAEHRKPSPRPFRLALRRLRVKAHETVYVADNPGKDFLGAKKVGIRTVRVRAPGSLYSTLEAPSPGHAPGAEVRRLRDLKGLLRQ
jgi:FMN phosphatase YigB (HAD superfamily)